MGDVDATRVLAQEHELEFVDLDTYGVDPGAGALLPASLSREHHVVVLKRRFGTPVIATSHPEDPDVREALRSSLGRDFISVVATSDQIGDYLDQLFGSEDGAEPRPELDGEDADGPFGGLLSDRSVMIPRSGNRRKQGKGRREADEETPAAETPLDEGPSDEELQLDEEPPFDEPSIAEDTLEVDDIVEVDEFPQTDEFDLGFAREEPVSNGSDRFDDAESELPTFDPPIGLSSFETEPFEPSPMGTDKLAELALTLPIEDPGLDVRLDEAGAAVDLSELAPPVSIEEPPESTADSAEIAADIVDEAVATYQEQHGDETQPEGSVGEESAETAMFPPLAKALVEGGRVSMDDMRAVLEEHERNGQSIARILTAQRLVDEADLMWGMAQEMGLEFVDLDVVGVDFNEMGAIPEATARHHNVIVIGRNEGVPVVAAANPTDVFAMDDLRTIMGRNFSVVVATRSQISSYVGRAFNSGAEAADMAVEASLGIDGSVSPEGGVDDIQAATDDAPIVRYVNLLILQALNERASDIHVEPTGGELRIRYRIDGVLHDVSTAPRAISKAVTTRLKVMADMNVAEHRIPQDGRISLNVGSKGIDLRMATLPTIHGEKVVMRVLDKSSVVLGFGDLGFDEDLLETYQGLYTKPYGTILVTGPTGSGKSTTLYTTLSALNSSEKNIITVEDPVELQLPGVNQVQLNVKAGLTFASALKSILRSDPDIVLVGEIRDKETAIIAIEAALTGHMVLATLHTNNAASTPMRLVEMGLEPFLVTSALSGVLAQRLARRLCTHCKEPYEPTEADIQAAGWTADELEEVGGMTKVYRSVGCSACSNTGYRGRKALAELLPMSEEIERAIIEGGSVDEIHRIAVSQGMMPLRQSGLRKAIEGETTLEEVLRVVA